MKNLNLIKRLWTDSHEKQSPQHFAHYAAILIMLLTLGVGQMWGDVSYGGGYFYFDNSLNVNKGYIMLCGRRHKENNTDNWYTAVTTFGTSPITGTKLYYTGTLEGSTWSTSTWDGWCVISDASKWNNNNFDNWSAAGWCGNYNSSYGFNSGSTYLLVPTSTTKSQTVTPNYYAAYSGLNHSQTIYKYTSSGGTTPASYTAQSVNSGTVTISAYKMTGNGTASNTSNSATINTASTTSASKDAAYTGEVTLTASANTGYSFVGWFESTSATTAISTETEYTYNAPNSTKAIYARFKAETTHPVSVTYICTETSATVKAAENPSVGEVTSTTFTAGTPTGFNFTSWTVGDGLNITSGNTSTNSISVTTKSSGTYTLRANYSEVLTSPWHLLGATTPFGGWSSSSSNMLQKASGSSTSSVASNTLNVSALPSAEEYTFKLYNDATDKWRTNAGYWVTRANNNPTLSTEGGEGNELIFKPDAVGDYVFSLNYSGSNPVLTVTFPTAFAVNFGKRTGGSSVTAKYNSVAFTTGTKVQSGKSVTFTQTAATGYTFEGWYNAASGGTKLSSEATYTTTISAATTVYANYTENKSTITVSAGTGGTVTTGSGTHSLGVATTQPIDASANPGYSWNRWTISGTAALGSAATLASNTAKTNGTAGSSGTITATFTANTWYVKFNGNGSTSGSMSNESFTYDAAAKALTSNAFSRTGYTFLGWATSTERANAGTVDYVNGASVSNLTTAANGIYNLYAVWQANNYTVTFDYTTNGGAIGELNGATNTAGVVTKSVTFGSAYGALPTATKLAKGFVGWFTTASDSPTPGTRVTAETIVSTASAHTLYARFEDTYEVTVAYKCGEVTLYPSTKVTASASSLTPEITAPEILGYTFSNWTGTNVTPADPLSATTTITATASTTITANYTAVPTVYFKNNLGWENVYVTFDCAFNSSKENVPANKDKPYFKMTQLGTSDIYYCAIPETYTASNYSGWAWNIAFDNTNMGSTAETTHTGSWDAFYGGEFLGRSDFDPKATMFIPYSEDSEPRNSGKCYTTGCWMKYNSTDPGYKIYANTYVEGSGSAVSGTPVLLTADVAGGFEFKAKVNFTSSNYTYGFMLGKESEKNTNDLWYSNGGTITSETNTLPWHFATKVDDNEVTNTGKRCGLKTEATGEYEFTVSFGTGRPVVDVTYPVSTGDYRLVYKDRATWSNGAHDASWNHPSRVIKANANAEDIVSFYVSKADGANASIKLHKCTSIDGSGNPVWDAGTAVDLSGISETGIYNFKVTQNESKVATVTFEGGYTGNFYIRTNASDGGWSNYKTSGKNTMTYSEYSATNHNFSHYFMRYVNAGTNIKFCIANDYSECISDTLVSDDYTNEWLEANANIRFMWYHATNKISRAYLSGSTIVSDRFLVLEGDAKMFDESGNALTTGEGKISGLNDYEMKFTDDENWIYEATVKAQPLARIKLTAKYNDKIQYFYGAEGARSDATTDVLIGGSGTDKYKMRIVYDFKTNRLMRAFIPDATITTNLAINADLMIIREHQEQAQQISFSGDGALSEVKTVYGAMKFNKYTVNGKAKTGGHEATGASRFERDLFYISFPFDVKLSDAFGFGEYGKHWIIEYYDGKGRAKNGFWADSEPNWKFVWPAQRSSFTMKAFEGYILALDLDEMGESSSVWDNGVEDVYVYFPSDGNVNNISATNRTITIDQEGYECKINRATPDGNRTVKDSYWHCIGVPSFANYSSALSPTSGGETIDWSTSSLPYLYEWNWDDNSLSVTTSATFDFKATWSYLVQYAGTSIYWSQVNVTPASIVARERTAPTNAEFRIELQQGGEKADQTFVRLTEEENVTTGFDFNYDLSKEYNKNRANIYTMVTTVKEGDASETQSAANVLPMSDQTTVVPVGVKIATTGDYTFAIPEGTAGVGVTLIDNETGIRTSLSALDYTINLSAGTYENRFVLEISPIKQMPTDIESVSDQHSAVRKVMIDGVLYIVKNGKVFDAHGNRVK